MTVIETILGERTDDSIGAAAQLLHDFNREYEEPAPPPEGIAARLEDLLSDDQVVVLLARERRGGAAVGVAVMRVHPSLWSSAQEAYLAELYVVPSHRGQGYGRELISQAMHVARKQNVTYAFLITSEDDRRAQRLYEAAGFRRTEGEDGPLMLAYEREL